MTNVIALNGLKVLSVMANALMVNIYIMTDKTPGIYFITVEKDGQVYCKHRQCGEFLTHRKIYRTVPDESLVIQPATVYHLYFREKHFETVEVGIFNRELKNKSWVEDSKKSISGIISTSIYGYVRKLSTDSD